MSFPIEKNVPIPPGGRSRYPWGSLEIGDSFLIEGDSAKKLQANAVASATRWAAGQAAKESKATGAAVEPRRFTTKKESETSVRIWRVA